MTDTKTIDLDVVATNEAPSKADDGGLPDDVAAAMAEFAGSNHTKLMRKLDRHLIPIVSQRILFRPES